MSLTAPRQATSSARRPFPVGGVEAKRSDGEEARAERPRKDAAADRAVPLEPHWQTSIDAATD